MTYQHILLDTEDGVGIVTLTSGLPELDHARDHERRDKQPRSQRTGAIQRHNETIGAEPRSHHHR